MKRILSILVILCLTTAAVFADVDGDEYDDGYVYQQNGAGDQFLKIELGALFPLNFDKHLKTGFEVGIGYYKFITPTFGAGGELFVTNNFSVGSKALFLIPITAGIFYQPTIDKFEFPLSFNAGFSTETWANMSYWPALTTKTSAGAYYRMSDSWSFGGSATLWTVSEFLNKGKNRTGIFMTGALNARYHF